MACRWSNNSKQQQHGKHRSDGSGISEEKESTPPSSTELEAPSSSGMTEKRAQVNAPAELLIARGIMVHAASRRSGGLAMLTGLVEGREDGGNDSGDDDHDDGVIGEEQWNSKAQKGSSSC